MLVTFPDPLNVYVANDVAGVSADDSSGAEYNGFSGGSGTTSSARKPIRDRAANANHIQFQIPLRSQRRRRAPRTGFLRRLRFAP
jgi:hypothetical protein